MVVVIENSICLVIPTAAKEDIFILTSSRFSIRRDLMTVDATPLKYCEENSKRFKIISGFNKPRAQAHL